MTGISWLLPGASVTALGSRKSAVNASPLFIATADLPSVKANPFYDTVNKVLSAHQFDPFVEQLCAKFYCDNVGRPGLAALLDAAGLSEPPEAWHLGFLVGPRINAGGRIGDAGLGARLLTTGDPIEARRIAEELDRLNRERQAIEAQAVADGYTPEKSQTLRVQDSLPGTLTIALHKKAQYRGRVVGLPTGAGAGRVFWYRPDGTRLEDALVASETLAAASAVPSVDPSSMTSTWKSANVCARTLDNVASIS